ncbi:efflux RND transporter permease subunit [Methylocapsa sp. S129]|uniref:efflux RND transporter permease subunit n=1 Tax=Methylocapsa sp. S129 TaxID=1641869 RepID=UPI00131D81C4|nr:efflux RND transporter permease subunit [Methylocapsa sp. S129]
MNSFNLSDWALRHKSLVWYFMLVALIAGVMSYRGLGREEDPAFTIKTMLIQAQWPGASVEDTVNQITDRIEKKLEELDTLDFTRSVTTPGQTTIFVNLKDTTKGPQIPAIWAQIRNMIADIRGQFPDGVVGPFFNDRFGDVYGNVYAFTSDGLSQRQLRDYVEGVRAKILTVPNAGRVDLIGAQDEVIFLEFSTRQIAALGLDQQAVLATLRAQNAISPSGVIQAGPERISVRVSGQFTSEDSLRNINLRVNDRFFRLSDVATISRGYVDPPSSLFRFNGQPAIGLAIGMKPNSNLLNFGDALDKQMTRITADLPIGVGVHLVSDQPAVVEEAVGGFTKALFEAVAIVLLVSFVSLGLRAGLVVALSIPLVLAITFLVMNYLGISLQRVSLGALIIALGLLVDDAMITVEMMVARLEAGDTRIKAATFAYTSTAFPMLTGTLVTIAGFIPIGLNSSNAGEYTFTLFVVIAAALIISWIVAVLFTPLLGVNLMPASMATHDEKPGWFNRLFAQALEAAMSWRWATIGLTLAIFAASLYGLGFVQQQFFPSSDRPELVVDFTLPENSSIAETRAQMDRFEATFGGDPDIDRWSSYVGQGAVRFYLPLDVQPANPYFGEMIIVTKSYAVRDRIAAKLSALAKKEFIGTDVTVQPLNLGPPVGRPIQYRVSGPELAGVRELAMKLASIVGGNGHVGDVVYDWNEPARVVKVDVLQDRARQLGVSSQDIASALNSTVGGATVTQVRDSIYLVDVIGRAREDERGSIETLQNLQLPGRNGTALPLAAVATFHYELEQPVVWRRARLPTITVKAGLIDSTQPATVVKQLEASVKDFADALPVNYSVATGGAVEESGKGQGPIVLVVPLMLFTMATLLMIQLQSFQRLFLVVAVAPLGLIGVVAALLPSGAPLGFVAILGVLALIGILIRNSVILIIQIETIRSEGVEPWRAVREATEHRMRPILLTAAAASLALIPISQEVFWGPMAYAMMGGIIVGTVLTLLFLPALYVAWFRIKEPAAPEPV